MILRHYCEGPNLPELDAVVYTREEDVGLAGPFFVGPGKEPWWKEVVDDASSPSCSCS